jgi:hypothetical protein
MSWHEGRVVTVHESAAGSTVGIDVQLTLAPEKGGSRFKLPPVAVVKTIKLSGSTNSAAELQALAVRALRCISGDKITLALLSDTSPNPTAETYALAETCRPGEIDFFLSHSWHDDPAARFAAIRQVVTDFKHKNGGRAPLFWLDKCCINQTKITESLRVLPIFLASCKRMLVLAGPTYVHRLWCIWELHMLFVSADGATPPVDVVGTASGTSDTAAAALYTKLREFRLDGAHCYDPNEERRLRSAIAAAPGGVAAFERTIRAMSGVSHGSTSSRALGNGPRPCQVAPEA